ncbi:RTA1 like protein-domain-containing protein [Aspergillus cavernicola]|uniref:RTA1 like protein-domain-containing protein n=1 Tax=Aspergillus cavernicola TaxID=176166 RepID=A0ABR4HIA4_9EURO
MDSDENNIYGYNPSIPAGALFLVLFGASTGYHIYQLIKARALYFIPFAIGGAFQVIGYLFRLLSHNNTDSTAKYALQTVLILIAPALYAASIYMVLGRLVTYLDAQQHSLVRVTWMTKIFVTGDVVSFLMQCGGGGLMAGDDPDTRTIGENITIIGLVVQVVFFGFFLITSIIFHWRINRTPTARSTEGLQHRGGSWMARNWVTLLIALYVVSVLILIRSVFRLVEFIDGYGGYLMSHEVFIYLFDATLMLFVMGILNFWHPCYVISDGKGYQRRADLDEVPLR